MIEVHELTKRYGMATLAVDRLSFSVARGEILGYLGPNGAGKSTTVKMLTGIIRPTSGTIHIHGQDLAKHSISAKACMGYVPESGGLYESLTAHEFLQLVGRLYQMEDALIDRKIREFLKLFSLEEYQRQRLAGFSKGMKQKVLIAAALIHNPEIIFLDEPLSGLDANTMLMLKEMLRDLAKQGKTIVYCSHILEVVERLCQRVIIINAGKIVADAKVEDLKSITAQPSLEGVFKQLTMAEDAAALGRAFSKVVTERP